MSGVASQLASQSRTHDIHLLALAEPGVPMQQGVAWQILQAIIAEAIRIGRDVAAIAHVIVMDAVDLVAADEFLDERQ
ncbi:MAG: hypothetical protein WDO73_12220 [Ignavibacteriota bacterium]